MGGLIAATVILAIGLLIVSFIGWNYYSKYKRSVDDWVKQDKWIEDLHEELYKKNDETNKQKETINELNRLYRDQVGLVADLKVQLGEMSSSSQVDANLDAIIKMYDLKKSEYDVLVSDLKKTKDELDETTDKKDKLIDDLYRCEEELAALNKELEVAKQSHNALIRTQNEAAITEFKFELDNKEQKLVQTIAEIKELYPELSKELGAVEWKKVWLPHIQGFAATNAVRGIYRLVLKDNKDICYVGQAVNIKERWYEHIKKMVGAEAKGGEKLYKYRPDDFVWTVVETDCKDLNEREKYWIQYWGCIEVGLNRKL